MAFLFDTNIISETVKPRPDANLIRWLEDIAHSDCYLSVVTLGEIRKGIELKKKKDKAKAQKFERWLSVLKEDFADFTLNIDEHIAEEWGRLQAISPEEPTDALFAATARVHGLTLVTRNVKHMMHWDVVVVNPFEEI